MLILYWQQLLYISCPTKTEEVQRQETTCCNGKVIVWSLKRKTGTSTDLIWQLASVSIVAQGTRKRHSSRYGLVTLGYQFMLHILIYKPPHLRWRPSNCNPKSLLTWSMQTNLRLGELLLGSLHCLWCHWVTYWARLIMFVLPSGILLSFNEH